MKLLLIVAPLAVGAVSALLTSGVRRYAVNRDLLDRPNERSSHEIPTPRGGGLAIVLACLSALGVGLAAGILGRELFLTLAPGGLMLAVVGFWDDHRSLSARARIMVQMAAVILALLIMGGLPDFRCGQFFWAWGWLGQVLGFLAMVWFINLFNFMDGIDGLAGIETVTVATAAGVIFLTDGQADLAWCAFILGAAAAGFLVFNWPPARIFMGDVGSGFLGFMLSALAATAMQRNPQWLWCLVIMLGVFEVDATITMVRRGLRGEKVYQAHRSHAYQHAARRWGHRKVTLGVLAINLFWLLPWALVSLVWPVLTPWALLLGMGPLVALALALEAGRE